MPIVQLQQYSLACIPTSVYHPTSTHGGMILTSAEQHAEKEQAVHQWLGNAWQHARAARLLAKRPGLEKTALYMAQQSMECAAKGICLNAGLPHKELTGARHNNLKLFLQFHGLIIEQTQSAPYIDDVLSDYIGDQERLKTESQLNRFLLLTTSPRQAQGLSKEQRQAARDFYASALLLSPAEVSGMLSLAANIRKNKKRWTSAISLVARNPLSLMPIDGKMTPSSLSNLFNRQILERLDEIDVSPSRAESNERFATYFLEVTMDRLGQDDLYSQFEAMNWEYTISKEDQQRILMGSFEVPTTFTEMLVVSGLVWPHESYTRYPASPEAINLSFLDAVATGQVGSGHYSSAVGVIAYIREISNLVVRITGTLKKIHGAGYLYASLEGK